VEQQAIQTPGTVVSGSRDGVGAGDHDQPFSFGLRPSSASTYPFTAMQYTHLLVLRGRVLDGEYADDLAKS
jgi:hypothetical protein